ncbi:MAG: SulP family inorganic anion transporter [Streptosporangiaceae bacterium]
MATVRDHVIAGVFRGMPVGGSMSASSLNKSAGAQTRVALMIASVVMAAVIVAFAGLVGYIAMPALAGLLILVATGQSSLAIFNRSGRPAPCKKRCC